jgi:hypothetical protein
LKQGKAALEPTSESGHEKRLLSPTEDEVPLAVRLGFDAAHNGWNRRAAIIGFYSIAATKLPAAHPDSDRFEGFAFDDGHVLDAVLVPEQEAISWDGLTRVSRIKDSRRRNPIMLTGSCIGILQKKQNLVRRINDTFSARDVPPSQYVARRISVVL